jgi:hypothetical protein
LAAANCYANAKTTHLATILLISVSKLDDARTARDVKAGRAAGARLERILPIYFNVLIGQRQTQVGFEPAARGENRYCLLV